jgi:hypothetical protein
MLLLLPLLPLLLLVLVLLQSSSPYALGRIAVGVVVAC